MEGTYGKKRFTIIQERSSHVRDRVKKRFLSQHQRRLSEKNKEKRAAFESSVRRYFNSPFAENVFVRTELSDVQARVKQRRKGKHTLTTVAFKKLNKELTKAKRQLFAKKVRTTK